MPPPLTAVPCFACPPGRAQTATRSITTASSSGSCRRTTHVSTARGGSTAGKDRAFSALKQRLSSMRQQHTAGKGGPLSALTQRPCSLPSRRPLRPVHRRPFPQPGRHRPGEKRQQRHTAWAVLRRDGPGHLGLLLNGPNHLGLPFFHMRQRHTTPSSCGPHAHACAAVSTAHVPPSLC